MIRDITLGQYYPAKSVIHQLDPRVKLVATMLYIISLFVAKGILGYVIATIFLAFVIRTSKVPFKFITKGLKAIVMLLMITVVFNLFLIDGDVVLWHFGFLKITDKGLRTAILMGVRLIYLIIGWSLRDLSRAKKFRYLAAVGGMLLLLVNLVFGQENNGARNWISLGGISFQPSELVKLCFLYVGASTMDRIVTKRNLFLFIVYSAAICGCLALMNDFGTALIFFVAFLVIAFLRSGSFATVTLACAATGFAGVLAVRFRPHILRRFATWGHAWEYASAGGYQQTRAMMCIASGGLFGLGAGNGWLKYVFAADTDLVFAFLCEEWGLIIGLCAVAVIVILAVFTVRSAKVGRSSFYTIAACAAVAILTIQTILNVFGTMDLLPLTGVTFPFLSNGGSSMLASWGLIAFLKAADTRQNASFAVRTAKAEEVEPLE